MRDLNLLMVGNFPAGTGYAWGMIERCFVAIGAAFVRDGARAVACFPPGGDADPAYRQASVDVETFDFARAGWWALFRYLRSRRIRVVYLVDWPVSTPRYLVLRLGGVRRIVEHDHTAGSGQRGNRMKWLLRYLANRTRWFSADRVLTVSDYVADAMRRNAAVPATKLRTVHNGIAADAAPVACDLHAQFAIPRGRRVILCAARANRYKGIEVLIDAADHLVNGSGRRDLHFLYLGDGPDLARFRERIAAAGLEDWFSTPGKVPSIAPLLPGALLSVAPSLIREGFGMVVIEAMAAGKPVVASRSGGMAELLEDGVDGCYVPPGDVAALALTIARIADDDGLSTRLGRAARAAVEARFSERHQHTRLVLALGEA